LQTHGAYQASEEVKGRKEGSHGNDLDVLESHTTQGAIFFSRALLDIETTPQNSLVRDAYQHGS
jgi:hypothetical protein